MSATEQHRQAYAYCAYCPKMCRSSCPVSNSTHQETLTPWGKMSQAFLSTEKGRALGPGGAKALYACTGCMRCRTECKHENEAGWALFDARELAVQTHQAPEAARTTLSTFVQHGNPFGEDLSSWVETWKPEGPVRYPLFTGCSALVKSSSAVEDALAVGRALSAPLAVCRASAKCCGYPLYAGGDQRAFAEHATKMVDALAPYPELVVLDPGCAFTFRVVYPRVGVRLPNRILTVTEAFAAQLDDVSAAPKLDEPVAYHDACHLGRGLGEYEAPRRLLGAAVSKVGEAADAREHAACSGGGGLLPRTMPETSVDVARRCGDALPAGATIATACPTARRMLERGGHRAVDLVSVLRRWLRA